MKNRIPLIQNKKNVPNDILQKSVSAHPRQPLRINIRIRIGRCEIFQQLILYPVNILRVCPAVPRRLTEINPNHIVSVQIFPITFCPAIFRLQNSSPLHRCTVKMVSYCLNKRPSAIRSSPYLRKKFYHIPKKIAMEEPSTNTPANTRKLLFMG